MAQWVPGVRVQSIVVGRWYCGREIVMESAGNIVNTYSPEWGLIVKI